MRNSEKAFGEILRVLKPGGYHIFTVPYRFDRETEVRIDFSGGEDIHLLPPEYHEDKCGKKIVVYRIFGYDMVDFLKSIGFETTVDIARDTDRRYGIFDNCVFVSRKPA